MTTLKDYARDLVIETQKVLTDKYFPEPSTPEPENIEIVEIVELTGHEIDDLVDEFIENIKIRLIGE